MRKLLLAATALIAMTGLARADLITVSATADGGAPVVVTSLGLPFLQTTDVLPIGAFTFNAGTFTSRQLLSAENGILSSNTINLQAGNGNHTLVIDVKGSGLSGPNSLQSILSTFSVSGMTAGWTVDEKTYINGVLQADTGVFTGVSDSASAFSSAFLGTTFMAEEIYTIHSFGKGDFNGGIVLSVAAVPEASTWAMLLLGFAGIGLMGLRKSRAGQAFRLV